MCEIPLSALQSLFDKKTHINIGEIHIHVHGPKMTDLEIKQWIQDGQPLLIDGRPLIEQLVLRKIIPAIEKAMCNRGLSLLD